MNVVVSAFVALALAASLAAVALLCTLDFPNLGTDHTLEDDGYLIVTTPDGNRHSAWDGEQGQQQ